MLTSNLARTYAQAMWGRGGTSSMKTNRSGAYFLCCSSHGGFVIDERALTGAERSTISAYLEPRKCGIYYDASGKARTFFHPLRLRRRRVPRHWTRTDVDVFVAEEDCDWSAVYVCTEIRLQDDLQDLDRLSDSEALARKTFWNWLDTNNPVVVARQEEKRMRQEGNPDLIVSCLPYMDVEGVSRVATADGNEHLVRGYENAEDEYGRRFLSRCEIVSDFVPSGLHGTNLG